MNAFTTCREGIPDPSLQEGCFSPQASLCTCGYLYYPVMGIWLVPAGSAGLLSTVSDMNGIHVPTVCLFRINN